MAKNVPAQEHPKEDGLRRVEASRTDAAFDTRPRHLSGIPTFRPGDEKRVYGDRLTAPGAMRLYASRK
jgi:hypothetical protein